MQLWIAAIICLAGVGLVTAFIWACRRDKKKRFLAIAVIMALFTLAAILYAALTLILVGGID